MSMVTIRVNNSHVYRIMRVNTVPKEVMVSFASPCDNIAQVKHHIKWIAVLRYHRLLAWRKKHKIKKIHGYNSMIGDFDQGKLVVTLPKRFGSLNKEDLRRVIVPFVMYLLDGTWEDRYESKDKNHKL